MSDLIFFGGAVFGVSPPVAADRVRQTCLGPLQAGYRPGPTRGRRAGPTAATGSAGSSHSP